VLFESEATEPCPPAEEFGPVDPGEEPGVDEKGAPPPPLLWLLISVVNCVVTAAS